MHSYHVYQPQECRNFSKTFSLTSLYNQTRSALSPSNPNLPFHHVDQAAVVVRRGGGPPSAPPCPERRRACSFSFFFSGSNSGGSGGLVLDFRNLVSTDLELRRWLWYGGGYGGFGGGSPVSRWTPTTVVLYLAVVLEVALCHVG
ncbi:hypothetical protein QL285_042597 [Trifolium repens]|nr:hypothetical protein QL285_042597 [Trifolium repens]